jgi:hypothetical protein
MAITLTRFKNLFMRFGKIIKISQIPGPVMVDLMQAHMGLVDQHASGLATEFDVSLDVVNPLGAQVRATNTALSTQVTNCKNAMTTYLQKFIAVELGLGVNATMAEINTALQTQMNAVVAHVALEANNSTGFAAYFKNNFNITLPTNASPSIPDSYITATVLADAT